MSDPVPTNREPGWDKPSQPHNQILQRLGTVVFPHLKDEGVCREVEALMLALKAAHLTVLRYPPVLRQEKKP